MIHLKKLETHRRGKRSTSAGVDSVVNKERTTVRYTSFAYCETFPGEDGSEPAARTGSAQTTSSPEAGVLSDQGRVYDPHKPFAGVMKRSEGRERDKGEAEEFSLRRHFSKVTMILGSCRNWLRSV